MENMITKLHPLDATILQNILKDIVKVDFETSKNKKLNVVGECPCLKSFIMISTFQKALRLRGP